jgi:micrococcal nuclease
MAQVGRWALVVGLVLLYGCAPDEDADPSASAPTATAPPFTVASSTPAGSTVSTGPVGRAERATVTRVVDGDTLEVRLADGRVERLRLVGINAPEDGECLSAAATRALAALVVAGPVRLVRDVSDRDIYDRLLRHVLVDGVSVGETLVAAGLALSRAYPPDTGRQVVLDAAQAEAEAAGLGLWSPDACGPASRAAVGLGRVRADPPGDESQTPNQEWIEVVNTGPTPVDLTGWGVKDESASHRFAFPDGFRLRAGAVVRIHTGCGSASATDLFWCVSGSAVWNNDGDTAFLTDTRGNVADQRPV